MINHKIASWIIILAALAFALAVGRAFGHVEARRPNSLGVNETYQNPNTYLLALPVDGKILDERFTNIRFWPHGTPELYDISLLFCGDVTDQFKGKTGVLALAYETQAHTMYKGVPCHTLLSVSEIK